MFNLLKRIIPAIVDTVQDPHLLSSRPHHAVDEPHQDCEECYGNLYTCDCLQTTNKGYEMDDKCCSNCGLVECTCDLQGLSDSEKESIGEHECLSVVLDGLSDALIIYSNEWQIVKGFVVQYQQFPDDINTKIVTYKIGNFLVTIQEVQE